MDKSSNFIQIKSISIQSRLFTLILSFLFVCGVLSPNYVDNQLENFYFTKYNSNIINYLVIIADLLTFPSSLIITSMSKFVSIR